MDFSCGSSKCSKKKAGFLSELVPFVISHEGKTEVLIKNFFRANEI